MNDLEKLIADHWDYVEGILIAGGHSTMMIEEIGYHYKTAWRHGWKHAMESK
jgi:hypothetical protein